MTLVHDNTFGATALQSAPEGREPQARPSRPGAGAELGPEVHYGAIAPRTFVASAVSRPLPRFAARSCVRHIYPSH